MKLRSLLLSAALFGRISLVLAAQDPVPQTSPIPTAPSAQPPQETPTAETLPSLEAPQVDVLGAMGWVPKGASTVILINHPGRSLDALDKLAERMKLKGAALTRKTLVSDFGGEPLLDFESSLVEFSYPLKGEKNEEQSKTVQLRIMRVPSMKAFLARFKPKAIPGGFSDFMIGKNPTVAAFRGGYAILAPKAHLDALKDAVAEREVFVLPSQSQRGWLLEQDVAMLFPPEVLAENPGDEAKTASSKDTFFAPLDALMAAVRKNPTGEVSHVVVGAKTEEAGGISIEARIGFMAGGQAAQSLAGIQGSLGDVAGMVSKGLPGSAYAMAMTAMIPAGYGPWLAAALASNGVKSTPEREARVAAMQDVLQDLKALGFVWSLGSDATKPLAGSVVSLQVENAEASLKKLEAYAKVKPPEGGLSSATDSMTSERAELGGRTLLKFNVPPPKTEAPVEGEAPKKSMVDPSAIFGKEPLPTLLWAYDSHTILVGFGEAETAFQASVQAIEHPEKNLGSQPAFALTQDMLGSDQQMQLFLSLQDIIGAAGRIMPLPIQLSDAAKTAPPLGLGLSLAANGMTLHAVAPAETVELVGTIIEAIMKISQDSKAAVSAEETPTESPKKAAPKKAKKAAKKKH